MKTYPVEKDGIIVQCCVCMRIRVIDENANIFFEEMKTPDNKRISFTYCPDCFPVAMAQAKADMEELKKCEKSGNLRNR